MKQLIIASLAFLIQNMCFANYKKIDSLKDIISTQPDGVKKCELLQTLGYQYEFVNVDSALIIYQQALQMAQDIKSFDEIGDTYQNMSFAYYSQGKNRQVIKSIMKAIEAYEVVDSIVDLADAYYNLGTSYQKYDKLDSAENAYLAAIPFSIKRNQMERTATTYNNLGIIYSSTGRINSAIKVQTRALRIRDSLKLPLLTSYTNLAALYAKQQLFERSLQYNRKAFNLIDSKTVPFYKEVIIQELGKSYLTLEMVDSAQIMFQKLTNLSNDSLKINKYKARINSVKNDFKKALIYYERARVLSDTSSHSLELIRLYNDLSKTLLKGFESNDFTKAQLAIAITYCHQSKRMAEKLGYKDLQEICYQLLYSVYELLHQPMKALKFAKKYIEIKQLNDQEKSQESLADAQTKYNLSKKNLMIDLLESKNKMAKLKNTEVEQKNQMQSIVSLTIGIALFASIIFLFIIFRQSKARAKSNSRLQLKNKTIKKQSEENELLLKEIHHRVKNNLQVISSLLELQAKKVANNESEVFKEGQSRVRAMALIHEELYQNKTLSKVDFTAYTKRLTDQIRTLFPEKNQVELLISGPKLQLDIDTAIPLGLILNELVTNAFKYGLDSKGRLSIEFIESAEGTYSLKVSDSGKGLPEDFELKKAKSLGLRLVNRLSKQLYGSFKYNKVESSTFTVEFLDTEQRKKVA